MELNLPSLTPSVLLQPYLPVVAFPTYFSKLYTFVLQLEQLCHKNGVDYTKLDLQRLTFLGLQLKKEISEKDFDGIFTFISEQLEGLLNDVNNEGFPLLLMHLYPFFQYPETSFEAVHTFLPPLAQHMSQKSIKRIFTSVIIRLFDTAVEPHHRGQLFSRTTADIILKRFGLDTFLNRFLSFLIEAVIEPLRNSSKMSSNRRINSNIVRMKSHSVLTLMTSDLLQSQVYEHGGGDNSNCDISSNVSYSLSMIEPGYDSDKDYSSGYSDDDDDDLAEGSLLAKSMLSPDAETDGAHSSPLIMTSQVLSGSGSDNTEINSKGGGEVNVPKITESLAEEDDTSRFSIISSLSLLDKQRDTLTSSYQDSANLMASSSQFDPTQSWASLCSEDSFAADVNFTSSLPFATTNVSDSGGVHQLRQNSLPVGMKLGMPLSSDNNFDRADEEEEEEGEEDMDGETVESDSISSHDPQVLAINLHVSEVAADCLSWLFRRLGPLLATQHIIRPLIDNLHRCFLGVLHLMGRERAVLKCLTAFAEYYGETVVINMYVPRAENMVCVLTIRLWGEWV